ncbi:hypothetical protein CERSUDRAFT_50292 [Gelatoporia subvermispora B]|uniref:Metallo-beta-lactamase domain-containing protein n=1 Tax=Ceriporiopsis subvermispora (strain B) TaxID=914234 RepID=M2PMD6_CERS8|nr:hypothetical protein CERSUDRAFT_50292 [Gelatoporia subvermispora B]
MGALRTVDQLTVTFLVDNCIEWYRPCVSLDAVCRCAVITYSWHMSRMTKLPPGFTLELRLHLSEDHKPPIDPLTGVPFVDLENYCCGAHGFSALIETRVDGEEPHLTLFDTGPDSRSIIRNVEALQVPVHRIERIVLSHWHADHSGGMLALLRYRSRSSTSDTPRCVADVHPDQPLARGIAPLDKVIARLPADPTFEEIEAAGGLLETHSEGHAVANDTVWVSGEIPRVTSFETGLPGAVRWINGEGGSKWIKEEDIMDERYAAIDVAGKGLVLFSACSHAGIVNVVKDAVSKLSRPIYMVIGGLHLAGADFTDRIPPTVNFLANQLRPAPTYVLPMHCSGFAAKIALESVLGEGCVPAGVGIKVDVQGNREEEQTVFPPSIA